jgi:hypothetical protein
VRFQEDVRSARDDAKAARDETDKLRGELSSENARRIQAERDLALIVSSSGEATRKGVADDIRKSPITIEIKGVVPGSPEERKKRLQIVKALANYMQIGQSLRNRCGMDPPESALESDADKWFTDVRSFLNDNLDSSFVAQFSSTKPTLFIPNNVPEKRIPLWHGLNQRVEILDKFIDQLRQFSQ